MIEGAEDRLSEDELDDQWYHLVLSTFKKMKRRVATLKTEGEDQKGIAHRIGMSDQQFSRLLRGQQNVTLRTLHRLARASKARLEVNVVPIVDIPKTNHRTSYPVQAANSFVSSGSAYIDTSLGTPQIFFTEKLSA
jgi:transcriptional regulator with XRE-family HTH domain